MATGTVKWAPNDRHFALIAGDDGVEYLAMNSDILDFPKQLKENQRVEFDPHKGPVEKIMAIRIRRE